MIVSYSNNPHLFFLQFICDCFLLSLKPVKPIKIIFNRVQRTPFPKYKRFISLKFCICKSVENPDTQIHVDTTGMYEWCDLFCICLIKFDN